MKNVRTFGLYTDQINDRLNWVKLIPDVPGFVPIKVQKAFSAALSCYAGCLFSGVYLFLYESHAYSFYSAILSLYDVAYFNCIFRLIIIITNLYSANILEKK